MSTPLDKRRRNARPSTYRPRTEAQKQRRRDLWEARVQERKAGPTQSEEDRLKARLAELDTALRDLGRNGVHVRRHTRPLEEITDDAERFAVLKARVERLEALWSVDRRKRETRGKIIIGGALLAELADITKAGEASVLASLLDILDRRVAAARDRLTVQDLLGAATLPLRPSDVTASNDTEGVSLFTDAPDFDAMVQSAMAEEAPPLPSEIDIEYAEFDAVYRARA